MSVLQARRYWDGRARRDPLEAVFATQDEEVFWRSGEEEIERMAEEGFLPPGTRALDYGAGIGRLSLPLSKRTASLVSADISRDMLAALEAKRTAPHHDTLLVRPCQALGGPFDLIVSFLVLQHMPPISARLVLARFAQALAPRGRVVIDLPVIEWEDRHAELHWPNLPPDDLWESRYYREGEIGDFLFAPAGLEVDRLCATIRPDRKAIVLRHDGSAVTTRMRRLARASLREALGYDVHAWTLHRAAKARAG